MYGYFFVKLGKFWSAVSILRKQTYLETKLRGCFVKYTTSTRSSRILFLSATMSITAN